MQPLIGVGIDYQLNGLPMLRELIQRFSHRMSHLSVVALFDGREARALRDTTRSLPIIHHLSGVAPADPDGPHWDVLAKQDALSKELDAVWCGEDIGIWSIGPYAIPYFAPPIFEAEIADLVSQRIVALQKKSSVPFLAEIPSCSFVAGRLTLGEFFHRLVDNSGCGVVLDLSHVYSYALYQGLSPEAVLRSLPLDAVWQIHVAGGYIHKDHSYFYVDSHEHRIVPEVYALLEQSVALCRELRAITYEVGVEMTFDTIEAEFTQLEQALTAVGFQSRIQQAAPH